jgi:hypothetical protein
MFKRDIIVEIILLEYWTFSQILSDSKKHNLYVKFVEIKKYQKNNIFFV